MRTKRVPSTLPLPNFRALEKKQLKNKRPSFFVIESKRKHLEKNKKELAKIDAQIIKVERQIKRTRR